MGALLVCWRAASSRSNTFLRKLAQNTLKHVCFSATFTLKCNIIHLCYAKIINYIFKIYISSKHKKDTHDHSWVCKYFLKRPPHSLAPKVDFHKQHIHRPPNVLWASHWLCNTETINRGLFHNEITELMKLQIIIFQCLNIVENTKCKTVKFVIKQVTK